MEPVSTIVGLLASFGPTVTARTAENLGVLFRGAILAHGPRTITGCLVAAWPWVTKHWSAYANVARRAKLNLLALARVLFLRVMDLVPPNTVVTLAIDESLVRRYGPFVVGVGMHRDAVRSSHSRVQVTPGHKWVVLSVLVKLPFVDRALALPVVSVLYTTAKHAARNRTKRLYRRHRTVPELALLMVRMVVRWAPGCRFRVLGDGSYGTHDLADAFKPASARPSLRRVSLVSRFHMDAATYAAPPPYAGRGRPRVKGEQLPSPRQVAASADTCWSRATVAWYGATRKDVLLCSQTGLWYRCGSEATPVRWVLVRDPEGKRRDEVFFTTETALEAKEVVEAFVWRWGLETTFQESRALLGLETLRNRAARAVGRSVPMLLSVYSLVVVWFAKHVSAPESWKRNTPWYTKSSVTFSDMLEAARQDILREALSPRPGAKTDDSILQTPPESHPYAALMAIGRTA